MITSGFYDSFNDDRKYSAEQFGELFDGIICDGVFRGVGNEFSVTESKDNIVAINTGRAWFDGKWIKNDGYVYLNCDNANGVFPRIDAVVLEVNIKQRAAGIVFVKGEASSNPQFPTITKNDDVKQYPIAYLYRDAGATKITSTKISNQVGKDACPYVRLAIDGVNTAKTLDAINGEVI